MCYTTHVYHQCYRLVVTRVMLHGIGLLNIHTVGPVHNGRGDIGTSTHIIETVSF